MSEIYRPTPEKMAQMPEKQTEIGDLGDFDMEYFQTLEGKDGWIAIGQENCKNQRYFTVYGTDGEKIGSSEFMTLMTNKILPTLLLIQNIAAKDYCQNSTKS